MATSAITSIIEALEGTTVTVNGVTPTARALDTLPGAIRAVDLPMRVIVLDETATEVTALTLGGAVQRGAWRVRDLLLWKPIAQGRGVRDEVPELVDYVAAYTGAVARQLTAQSFVEEMAFSTGVWQQADGMPEYHHIQVLLTIKETF
jgi:hypothetical protein